MTAPTPCLICNAALDSSAPSEPGDGPATPSGATIFVSHGNYGSTVFDPIWGSPFLQVNICDGCLLSRVGDRIQLVTKTEPRPEFVSRAWSGEGDEYPGDCT